MVDFSTSTNATKLFTIFTTLPVTTDLRSQMIYCDKSALQIAASSFTKAHLSCTENFS